MSANPPRFKTLRAYKDPVSAGDWNALAAAVSRLCRSMGAGAVFDSNGLHFRPMRQGGRPAHYKVQSNDGEGAYTLRPQLWDEQAEAFGDRPDAGDVDAYEIHGNADLLVGQIVAVPMEVSLQGRWIGLIDFGPSFLWGVVAEDWPGGNVISVHPCDDETGASPVQETIPCYLQTPIDGDGPLGCRLLEGDVVAYLLFADVEGIASGLLIGPPVYPYPPGGDKDYPLTKKSSDDYDVQWDLLRFVNA